MYQSFYVTATADALWFYHICPNKIQAHILTKKWNIKNYKV